MSERLPKLPRNTVKIYKSSLAVLISLGFICDMGIMLLFQNKRFNRFVTWKVNDLMKEIPQNSRYAGHAGLRNPRHRMGWQDTFHLQSLAILEPTVLQFSWVDELSEGIRIRMKSKETLKSRNLPPSCKVAVCGIPKLLRHWPQRPMMNQSIVSCVRNYVDSSWLRFSVVAWCVTLS